MNRRTLLRGLAGAAVLSLGGCTARDDGNGGPGDTPAPRPTESPTPASETTVSPTDPTVTGTPPPTDAETPTTTPTPAAPGAVTGRSFSVGGVDCGQQRDGASVSWDRPDSTVTVTGTIWGRDTCSTAELAGVSLEDDTLTVTVRATRRASAGETTACGQCIVEIDYEATVSFDRGLPGEVVVVHQHGDDTERVVTERF